MPVRMFAMSSWTSSNWNSYFFVAALLCAMTLLFPGCNSSSDDSFTEISDKDIKIATVDESKLKKPEIEVSSTTSKKIETKSNTIEPDNEPQPTQKKETPQKKNDAEMSAIDKPREIKLLVKEKTFKTVGPEGAIRVSYDDIDLLKVLNMEKAIPDALEYFPDWLKNLEGQRIRIRGFMYTLKSKRITSFMLTRDTDTCCFGPNAKIYDRFPVTLRKGHRSDYIFNRPFDVVGVFKINPWIEEIDGEDQILELYHIEDAIIIH